MKYKGVIPEGYELVKGRYGHYLRKLTGTKPVNKTLTRNSNKMPRVNRIAGAMQKGITAERKYFYDGTLYNRLKGHLLRGSELAEGWWTKDWLEGFEVNALHLLKTVADFTPSYAFKRNTLTIQLEGIFLTEWTRRKGKSFNAVRLHAVVLFIDEDKGKFTRYESEPQVTNLKTKSIRLEVVCTGKPKLPFVIFIYGVGMEGRSIIENADATGMVVIGSGIK